MKKAVLAAATAAATLWGGIALAQDNSASVSAQTGDQQTQVQTDENGNVKSMSTSQTPQDTWRDRTLPDQQTGVGGSGPAVQVNPSTPSATSDHNMMCNCREQAPSTSGAATDHSMLCNCREVAPGTGGSGFQGSAGTYNQGQQPQQGQAVQPSENYPSQYQQQPQQPSEGNEQIQGQENENEQGEANEPGETNEQTQNEVKGQQQGTGGSGETVVIKNEEEQGPNLSGVTVMLGGGVEGFTGSLAPELAVGPTYGAALQLRPTDILGLEFAYSGAVHEIKSNVTHGVEAAPGADIVRNGARALATIGLLQAPVQPYLAGGVGVNWYNVRGRATSFGFKDDTAGEVPLGLGIRTQVGAFTADLRGLYDIPFNQDFAPGTAVTATNVAGTSVKTSNDGRYQATLAIGANF